PRRWRLTERLSPRSYSGRVFVRGSGASTCALPVGFHLPCGGLFTLAIFAVPTFVGAFVQSASFFQFIESRALVVAGAFPCKNRCESRSQQSSVERLGE